MLSPQLLQQEQLKIDSIAANFTVNSTVAQLEEAAGRLAAIIANANQLGLKINLAHTPTRMLDEAAKLTAFAAARGSPAFDDVSSVIAQPEFARQQPQVNPSPLPHHFVGGGNAHYAMGNAGNPSADTMAMYAQHAPINFTPRPPFTHPSTGASMATQPWLASPLTATPAQLNSMVNRNPIGILGPTGPDAAQPFANGTGMHNPPLSHTSVTPSRFIAPASFFAPADFLKSDSASDYEFMRQESLDLVPVFGGGYRIKQQLQPGKPPSTPIAYLQACDRLQEWALANGRFTQQDVREHSRFVRAILDLNDRWSSPWATIMELDTAYRKAVFSGEVQSFDDKIQLATLATLRLCTAPTRSTGNSGHSNSRAQPRKRSKQSASAPARTQSGRGSQRSKNNNKSSSTSSNRGSTSSTRSTAGQSTLKHPTVNGEALCRMHQAGRCTKGSACTYSHAFCGTCKKPGHTAATCNSK